MTKLAARRDFMVRDYRAWTAHIAARQNLPFAWGSHDCVTFAAGAIRALTGADPLADIPAWTDEASGLHALARRGGLVQAVSAVLDEVPLAHAHRGDVCAVEGEQGAFLMVIEGMTFVGPGIAGLYRVPRVPVIAAWSATSLTVR